MSGVLKFPDGFLWGTATSPTQVEGQVVNEWAHYVAADGGHFNGEKLPRKMTRVGEFYRGICKAREMAA
jgi:beta-glucosidase/6-phospho-beta-glucosidase/beta-galactosidase